MGSADLDYFWVEHRDDLDDAWQRHESLPVRWADAVGQLRHAAEAALAGADDDDSDDVTVECRELLATIDKGRLLPEVPYPASLYTGRYLRIVSAAPSLRDRIAAELRFWVIENAQGLATVTITTYAGRTLQGTVAWEDIEPNAVTLSTGDRTTMLRSERIESFTVDPNRHPARQAS